MRIIVLNDGETFSAAQGCLIAEVPDNADIDEIERLLKEGDAKIIAEFQTGKKIHIKI